MDKDAEDVSCTEILQRELAQAVGENEHSEIVWQTLICAYLDHEGWRSLAEAVFKKYGYTLEEIRLNDGCPREDVLRIREEGGE